MSKELKFDLNVETNALLCPNPQEFYAKAYITQMVADNFRTLPGIKTATKLANVVFDQLLKASGCDFVPSNSTLDAIDISVCPLSAMAEVCQFDLEQSFLSLQMAAGSNGNWNVVSFMSFYWEQMAAEIGQEIELIRWQGDTLSLDPILALCDGHLKRLLADATVVDVANVASTVANVITELTKIVQALPSVIKGKKSDLRLYVSSNIAQNYEIAAASGNTQAYVTEALMLKFIGITMVVCEGLPVDTAILTLKNNLVYAFDADADSKQLKAVNLEDSVAEPKLRTRANLKVGFWHTNGAEIVLYS
jgi:hypothetical protein